MSGQGGVISELLAAGLDPYAPCSKGETPVDLARRWEPFFFLKASASFLFFCSISVASAEQSITLS